MNLSAYFMFLCFWAYHIWLLYFLTLSDFSLIEHRLTSYFSEKFDWDVARCSPRSLSPPCLFLPLPPSASNTLHLRNPLFLQIHSPIHICSCSSSPSCLYHFCRAISASLLHLQKFHLLCDWSPFASSKFLFASALFWTTEMKVLFSFISITNRKIRLYFSKNFSKLILYLIKLYFFKNCSSLRAILVFSSHSLSIHSTPNKFYQ